MPFSVWVRESSLGFPLALVMHALGMGFLVGVHFALDLRVLGEAPGIPVYLLRKFFPLMWGSFALALISGLMLLLAYPAKGLTNPVFFLKLLLVAAALSCGIILGKQTRDEKQAISTKHRTIAIASLVLWISVITAGRFLAYTYSILLTTDFY